MKDEKIIDVDIIRKFDYKTIKDTRTKAEIIKDASDTIDILEAENERLHELNEFYKKNHHTSVEYAEALKIQLKINDQINTELERLKIQGGL